VSPKRHALPKVYEKILIRMVGSVCQRVAERKASSHLAAFILLSATLADALPKVPYFASYAGQLPGCFNVMFGSVGLSLEVVVVGVVRGPGAWR